MVSSEAVGTAGVGLGVGLIVLDFTTAGMALMLLGVGGAIVAAALNSGNDRAQTTGPIFPVTTVVVIVLGVYVTGTISRRFEQAVSSATTDGPVHLCGGAGGCGVVWNWAILAVIGAATLGLGVLARRENNINTDSDTQ